MGVKGLWNLCAPVGREISVESLEHTTLAIDVSIWLIQFIKAMRDDEGRTIRHAHLIGTLRRICRLLFHGIRPVFVFDGGVPAAKARLIRKRQQRRAKDSNRAETAAKKLYARQIFLMEQKKKQSNHTFDPGVQRAEQEQQQQTNDSSESEDISWEQGEEDEKSFVVLHENFDKEVFASIPNNERKDAVERAQRFLRVNARNKYLIPVAHNPDAYSESQISSFLRRAKFSRRVEEAQKESEKHDSFGGDRIQSDGNRRYLLLQDDNQDENQFNRGAAGRMQRFLSANRRFTSTTQKKRKKNKDRTPIYHQDPIEMQRLNEERELNDWPSSDDAEEEKEITQEPPLPTPCNIPQPRLPIEKKRKQAEPIFHEDPIEMQRLNEERELNAWPSSDDDNVIEEEQNFRQPANRDDDLEGGFVTEDKLRSASTNKNDHDIYDDDEAGGFLLDDQMNTDHNKAKSYHTDRNDDYEEAGGFLLDDQMNTDHNKAKSYHTDRNDDYDEAGGFLPDDQIKTDQNNAKSKPNNDHFADSDDADDCNWEAVPIEETVKHTKSEPIIVDSDDDCAWEAVPIEETLYKSKPTINLPDSSNWDAADEKNQNSPTAQNEDVIELSFSCGDATAIQTRLHEMFGDVHSSQTSALRQEVSIDKEDAKRKHSEAIAEAYQTANKMTNWAGSVFRQALNDSGHEVALNPKRVLNVQSRRIIEDISDDDNSKPEEEEEEGEFKLDAGADDTILQKQSDHEESKIEEASEEIPPGEEDSNLEAILIDTSHNAQDINVVTTLPEWRDDENPSDVARREKFYEVCEDFDEQLAYAVERAADADLDGLTAAAEAETDLRNKRALQYVIWAVKRKLVKDTIEKQQLTDEHEKALEDEMTDLRREMRNKQVGSDHVTEEMRQSVMHLLDMLGFPYVIAPMEAEAQCAYLEKIGAVEGIVTDDSDALVFGSKRVYKNIFSDTNNVEAYYTSDLHKELELEQRDFIAYALLLGGDYADGVKNVGIVNAAEILRAFRKKNDQKATETLGRFKKWLDGHKMEADDVNEEYFAEFDKKKKKARFRWQAPPGFPSEAAEDQYLNPQIAELEELIKRPTTWGGGVQRYGNRGLFDIEDIDNEGDTDSPHPRRLFKWSDPNEERLLNWCKDILGWNEDKIESSLRPALDKHKERMSRPRDTRLDAYYDTYHTNKRFARVHSKRLRRALGLLVKEDKKKPTIKRKRKKEVKKKKRKKTKKSTFNDKKDIFVENDSDESQVNEEKKEDVDEQEENEFVFNNDNSAIQYDGEHGNTDEWQEEDDEDQEFDESDSDDSYIPPAEKTKES